MNNIRHISITICLILLALSVACTSAPAESNLTPQQALEAIQQTAGLVILDVRTPAEFSAGHIAKAVNIDFYEKDFQDRIKALDKGTPYFVYCRSGNRSGKTLEFMNKAGFKAVQHLDRGINAWVREGLPIKR